jgi:hypothetical protein
LLFSWTGVAPVVSGSTPFVYNGSGGWGTACVGDNLTTWAMFCGGSGLNGQGTGFPNSGCTGTAVWNWFFGMPAATAYPFTINITVSNFSAFSAGWRTLTISDPSPGSRCCFVYFNITGCNGSALPGATVSIWTNSTKTTLLATGTTDASGYIDLNIATAGGAAVYYEVAYSPRFTTAAVTTGTIACGQYNDLAPLTVALSPAAGYTCLSSCEVPLANTIHATFSTAGLVTLIKSGANWTATGTVAGQTYVFSFDGSAWTITRNGVSCGAIGWSFISCPPSFAGTLTIPAGACTTELGSTATISE